MKNIAKVEKYLNSRIYDLVNGRKIKFYNRVYWANYNNGVQMLYALSLDAFVNGVIDGYVCGYIKDMKATIDEE